MRKVTMAQVPQTTQLCALAVGQHRHEQTIVLRMEFKTFVNAFIRIPCQIVRTGRKLIYRILSWNPWQHMFFRTFAQLRC
jgi:hypothetical protein